MSHYYDMDVDNRERARTRDKNQKRRISLEQKMKVRKSEILEATEVKMSRRGKKGKQEYIRHFLYKTCN